ncbi:MAG TPA: tetratricopeptide repeat protein [Burkholderiaceae bacterium]|nr:tetratricopeptide repeat protein [Burkholderiaceae bacterium]
MDVLLALATLIGGAAAAWYFWDKWRDRRLPLPSAAAKAAPRVADAGAAARAARPTSAVARAEPRAAAVLTGEDIDAVRAALEAGRHTVVAALRSSAGRVIEHPGYSITAVFVDAQQCFAAAIEARDALARSNSRLPLDSHVHYRWGIDVGAAADMRPDPSGDTCDEAARLAGSAADDAICLTPQARAQLPADSRPQASAAEAAGAAGAPQDGGASVPPPLRALGLPVPQLPSVILLPFTCIGDDSEAEVLAEGLRIDIQNALVRVPGLFVIAAGTAQVLRGVAPAEAAACAGVRHVLQGQIQRSGARVRANVQLLDALAGVVRWSERYDRAVDDALTVQDEIAAQVVTALDVRLSSGLQARIWRKCLTDIRARDQFYRGLQCFFGMTRESVAAARECFERVAELAPHSAHGPSNVAICLWLQATRGWTDDPAVARDEAGRWAERAVTLEDADGQAHTVLGNVRLLQHRFDEALAISTQAIEIRPGCTNANGFLANVLLHCAQPERAITHARRALRHAPLHPPWFIEILAAAYREAGELSLSIAAGREALRRVPQTVNGRAATSTALIRAQWHIEAARIGREMLQLDPRFSVARHVAAQPYRDRAVAERLQAELLAAGLPE